MVDYILCMYLSYIYILHIYIYIYSKNINVVYINVCHYSYYLSKIMNKVYASFLTSKRKISPDEFNAIIMAE